MNSLKLLFEWILHLQLKESDFWLLNRDLFDMEFIVVKRLSLYRSEIWVRGVSRSLFTEQLMALEAKYMSAKEINIPLMARTSVVIIKIRYYNEETKLYCLISKESNA